MRYETVKTIELEGVTAEIDSNTPGDAARRVHLRDVKGNYVMLEFSDYSGIYIRRPAPPPTVKRWKVGEAKKGVVVVAEALFDSKYAADAHRDELIDGCGFNSSAVPEAVEVEVVEQ